MPSNTSLVLTGVICFGLGYYQHKLMTQRRAAKRFKDKKKEK
jgi:hypothetical protein